MAKVIKQEEDLMLEGISISEMIKDEIKDKIKKMGLNIEPISIVFIVSELDDAKKQIFNPVILSHQNKVEIDKKIIHITRQKTKATEEFVKTIEKM